jgi:hypothetical protein
MTDLMPSTGGALDERVVARATLDAAEEELQSLCGKFLNQQPNLRIHT